MGLLLTEEAADGLTGELAEGPADELSEESLLYSLCVLPSLFTVLKLHFRSKLHMSGVRDISGVTMIKDLSKKTGFEKK
jgi:hypothetical protein